MCQFTGAGEESTMRCLMSVSAKYSACAHKSDWRGNTEEKKPLSHYVLKPFPQRTQYMMFQYMCRIDLSVYDLMLFFEALMVLLQFLHV